MYDIFFKLLQLGAATSMLAAASLIVVMPVDPHLRKQIMAALLLGLLVSIGSVSGIALAGLMAIFRS